MRMYAVLHPRSVSAMSGKAKPHLDTEGIALSDNAVAVCRCALAQCTAAEQYKLEF